MYERPGYKVELFFPAPIEQREIKIFFSLGRKSWKNSLRQTTCFWNRKTRTVIIESLKSYCFECAPRIKVDAPRIKVYARLCGLHICENKLALPRTTFKRTNENKMSSLCGRKCKFSPNNKLIEIKIKLRIHQEKVHFSPQWTLEFIKISRVHFVHTFPVNKLIEIERK